MRVVVEIPPDLVDRIRTVLRQGGYEDPEEFLQQALRTQVELEEGGDQPVQSFEDAISSGKKLEDATTALAPPETEKPKPGRTLPHPEDLSSREFDVNLVNPPAESRIECGPLWGQYNRIFPAKLVVRRLALVLDRESKSRLSYRQFRTETAQTARTYGLRLKEVDDKKGRGRGKKLAAALPTGEKAERSLERFKTHFVGQIDSGGDLTGMTTALKFLDISEGDREFGLTEFGRKFAELENPLLDDSLDVDRSLSDTERQFYLAHTEREHPAEYNAMVTIAYAIEGEIESTRRPE